MYRKDKMAKKHKHPLYNNLSRLNVEQLKVFYCVIVHYWSNYKYFLSPESFLELWCEANNLCARANNDFPRSMRDRQAIKHYCQVHPYYFIDLLPTRIVADLFYKYLDKQIGVLTVVTEKILTEDLTAALSIINKAFSLYEDVDEATQHVLEHVKCYHRN